MVRITWLIGAVAPLLLTAVPVSADEPKLGCFSDGDYIFLHGGITYQYFVDKGDQPVECTADAVKLGLELAEEAVKASCEPTPTSLCDEKKQYVQLIRTTYGQMLPPEQADATAVQVPDIAPAAGATAATPAQIAPAQTASTAGTEAVNIKSRSTIRWVQTSLLKLGYEAGKADGAVGRRTAAAIRKYETDNGLPATGKMSAALVASLKQRTGQP